MSSLPITNVVTVSVSTPPAGLGAFQSNNLAIFTKEAVVGGSAVTFANPGIYVSPTDVAVDFGTGSEVYAMANAIFSQSPNILNGDGRLIIFPIAGGDTIASVVGSAQSIQFFAGLLYAGYAPNDAELIAGAVAVEPLRIKLFASSYLTSALTPSTGVFAIIHAANEPHTRKLLYTQAGTALGARLMAAAYAGRAMSVDFSGVATTATMHLKTLVGITGDLGITQAILTTCQTLGVDVYPVIGGLSKVFCSGGDDFWDNVYNLDAFVFDLQVAGFNALATVGTKLPQTEPGMAVLRGAYQNVLQQYVRNGFVAPGEWNSAELFGDPEDLLRNILAIGWYLFSNPVNAQSQAQRVARIAPLIQIAIKYAGAIHSTSVVVSVNP